MSGSSERRSNPRSKVSCFALCRQPDAPAPGQESLCVIQDFSHDGIHFLFLGDDDQLRQNKRLMLRFPYMEQSPTKDREFLVDVMRVNPAFHGRCGVGAKLVLQVPMQLHEGLLVPKAAFLGYVAQDVDLQNIDLYA